MASTPQLKVGGIVLAGSHLWGESPLDWIGPRPLLPVAGRPLLWYGLEWLRRSGIEQVTVCANSNTAAIQACLGDGSGMGLRLDYYEDLMPRGPAGCIRDAALGSAAPVFVVVEGALLPHANLSQILKAHRDSESVMTIVALAHESGNGGERQLKPAGIYVINRAALGLVPPRGYQDIKEMWIPRLHEHGCRITPYVIEAEAAVGVTGLGSYLRAAIWALEKVAGYGGWGGDYRRIGSAWVHRSARVSASAGLSEHVLVGPKARVDADVVILGRTIIGPNSRIKAAAILSDTVTWPGCEVGPGAILNRCILLAGSIIEPELVVRDTVWRPSTIRGQDWPGESRADYWAMASPAGTAPPSKRLATSDPLRPLAPVGRVFGAVAAGAAGALSRFPNISC
jgi:mannose-1-phosphate guanylyltransferase